MATKLKAVMAYATEEERAMLKALSHATGKTDSRWLIDAIRVAYDKLTTATRCG